jgi:hypothetical protein
MNLARMASIGALIGGVLLSGCNKKGAGTSAEMKDSEVRMYIDTELRPYLDSLTYQVCALKVATAPTAPGREVCPPGPPDGYKPPPTNGKP